MKKITASPGNVFRRIHDQFVFGDEIYLGIDYSTGTARKDSSEYYEEVLAPAEENIELIERSISPTTKNTPNKTKILYFFKRILKIG